MKGNGRLNFFGWPALLLNRLPADRYYALNVTSHILQNCSFPNLANVSPQFEEGRNVLLRHAKRKDLAGAYQSAQNTYSFNKWDKK